MNYKNEGIAELTTISDEFEEYRLGQIICGVIATKDVEDTQSIKEWLYNISDEDLYTKIEEMKLKERE